MADPGGVDDVGDVRDVDETTVLRLGGWSARWVRVLALEIHGDAAVALLDADSDLNVDILRRDAGAQWRSGAGGSVNDTGPAMTDGLAYHFGEAPPGTPVIISYRGQEHTVTTSATGWWLFFGTFDDDQQDPYPVALPH